MDIQTRETRIHIRSQGDGALALVFLHYWGGSSRTWDAMANELSSGYRTVAIDHRGWGDSDAPEHGYAIADLANDAQDVIGALRLSRYILVGHSMGGKVAQLLASRRPKGLEGLVLVAPSPPSPMTLPAEQREAMVGAYATRESVEYVLNNVLTARPLTAAQREQVIADSLRGAAQAKSAWPRAAMLEDITHDVAAINVPVLVIAGELDQVERLDTLKLELLPHIGAARLHVIPETGHLVPLESPEAAASALLEFLADLESGQKRIDAPRSPEQVPTFFDDAFNAGDIDRLIDVFSENATMRMADGKIVASGHHALRQQLSPLLEADPRIHNRVRLALVSDDVALVLLDWTTTATLPDGQAIEQSGVATQVMTRDATGIWKLRISNPLGAQ